MQTYVDLIQRRSIIMLDKFDRRQIDQVVAALKSAKLLPENPTELQILKVCCEVLYTIHYLSGANNLPLDDAYSKMLMHNSLGQKETDDPIEYIFNQYRLGKLHRAVSPIHALMERINSVEKIKDKEIASLKEQRNVVCKLLEDNGIEIPISNPSVER